MNLKIGVIKGDGIGPEIVTEAMKVLNKVAEVYGHTCWDMCSMVIIHPADKDTAMDTDVTAITAVMEATTEVMVNTELTVTMARWKKVRRTSLAV